MRPLGKCPNLAMVSGATWTQRRKVTGQGHTLGPLGIGGANRSLGLALFPEIDPSFPSDVTDAVCRAAGVSGILGNCLPLARDHSEIGQRHVETGQPICYTSIDSVFQIAAHETLSD